MLISCGLFTKQRIKDRLYFELYGTTETYVLIIPNSFAVHGQLSIFWWLRWTWAQNIKHHKTFIVLAWKYNFLNTAPLIFTLDGVQSSFTCRAMHGTAYWRRDCRCFSTESGYNRFWRTENTKRMIMYSGFPGKYLPDIRWRSIAFIPYLATSSFIELANINCFQVYVPSSHVSALKHVGTCPNPPGSIWIHSYGK